MSDSSASIIGTGDYRSADEVAHAHERHGPGHVAHQFDDAAQQKEAATLGMWAFLATEVMFFGGIFLTYAIYRSRYPEAFAQASAKENWFIGALNTGVLLCSSFTVVLAVYAAHHGDRKGIIRWMLATIVLGLMFVGVKAWEYNHLFHEHLVPGRGFDRPVVLDDGTLKPRHFTDANRKHAEIFFSLYFCATGLHALHMVIGVGIMGVIAWMAHKGRFSEDYYNPVEISGLYWHFVDIVWIFLYPMLYLIDPVFKFW